MSVSLLHARQYVRQQLHKECQDTDPAFLKHLSCDSKPVDKKDDGAVTEEKSRFISV